jgi:hypothetical protein
MRKGGSEQIAYALRQAKAEGKIVEICCKLGVSEQIFKK